MWRLDVDWGSLMISPVVFLSKMIESLIVMSSLYYEYIMS